MKAVILCLLLCTFGTAYSQYSATTVLFIQCYFEIPSKLEMLQLEVDLRNHPKTKLVRLDFHSQRAFILTKNLSEISKNEVLAWFEEYSETVSCVQIGVKGIDKIEPYPFTHCDDE